MESKSLKSKTLSTQNLEQCAAALHGIEALMLHLLKKVEANKRKNSTGSLSQRRAAQNKKWLEEVNDLKTIYPHWKNQFIRNLNEVDLRE